MVDDITPRRNDEHRHKEDAAEKEHDAGCGAHRRQRPPPAAERRAWASSNIVSSSRFVLALVKRDASE
jgi:hypothetical protein